MEHEPVYAVPARGQWFDIGSLDAYRQALAWAARGGARSPRARAIGRPSAHRAGAAHAIEAWAKCRT
jgi:NDP-sugar pyrophosphorylase family protein